MSRALGSSLRRQILRRQIQSKSSVHCCVRLLLFTTHDSQTVQFRISRHLLKLVMKRAKAASRAGPSCPFIAYWSIVTLCLWLLAYLLHYATSYPRAVQDRAFQKGQLVLSFIHPSVFVCVVTLYMLIALEAEKAFLTAVQAGFVLALYQLHITSSTAACLCHCFELVKGQIYVILTQVLRPCAICMLGFCKQQTQPQATIESKTGSTSLMHPV